jgi:hypothetical protein
MSGSGKRPDWLDLDPTAGHELSVCGKGYVPTGTLCRDCTHMARTAELRKFYEPDEAEVRAIVELEYLGRRMQALFSDERVLPATSLQVRQVRSVSEPRSGKVLQAWEATATTGEQVDVWIVVGPDPWEMFPADPYGGAEGALNYYRMTQR